MQPNLAKPLDINAFETVLDELLRCYGQALKAVELLPMHGRVSTNEYIVVNMQPARQTRNRIGRLWISLSSFKLRNTDWIRSRHAIRYFAKLFLRFHIRSKLQTIADRLEIERLAVGYIGTDNSDKLEEIIKKLYDYGEHLTHRRAWWFKVPKWIWAIASSALAAGVFIPVFNLTFSLFLIYLAIFILMLTLFSWAPLFTYLALDGFRWKRLILLGQIGDINIDISDNVFLRWVPAPAANTYSCENRLFELLGIKKPNEFPWDIMLLPTTTMTAALGSAIFLVGIASVISTTKLDWSLLIDSICLILTFFCFRSIWRRRLRTMGERKSRSAC